MAPNGRVRGDWVRSGWGLGGVFELSWGGREGQAPHYESIKREVKIKSIYETIMRVGVMKDYKLKLGSYVTHIHWVDRGTGTPKDRDEVN